MRTILILVVMLFSVITANAQFSEGELQATGLTCAMCNNAINKSLKKLPFINSVESDIKNSSFRMKFGKDDIDIDAIRKAVEDAGFSVGKLQLTGNFPQVAIGDDKHAQIGKDAFHFLNTDLTTLSGERTITIVDKNFLSAKQFRKLASTQKHACVQSGKAESCCEKEGVKEGSRVYHATL